MGNPLYKPPNKGGTYKSNIETAAILNEGIAAVLLSTYF